MITLGRDRGLPPDQTKTEEPMADFSIYGRCIICGAPRETIKTTTIKADGYRHTHRALVCSADRKHAGTLILVDGKEKVDTDA